MNKQQAQQLDQEIREALVITADKIEEFILGYGWKHLGHGSVLEWLETISDIQLATPVVKFLVYKLIDDGELDESIAECLQGVGPETVSNLRNKHKAGVPHQLANGQKKPRHHSSQIITVVEWRSREEKSLVHDAAKAAGLTGQEYLRKIALESVGAYA